MTGRRKSENTDPGQARKKKGQSAKGRTVSSLSQLARGMPSLDNVKEVADFVSPEKVKYKILKTNETDAYDPPPASAEKPGKR